MLVWITASAPLLMKEFGLGEKAFGLAQVPVFSAYILGAQLRGRLHKKLSLRSSILGSLVTSIGASLVLSFLAYQSLMSLWNLLFFVSLLSLAIGFVMPALNKEAFSSSSEEKGVTSAMFYMIMILNGTFFSLASGTLAHVNVNSIYWLLNLSTIGSLLIFRKMISKT